LTVATGFAFLLNLDAERELAGDAVDVFAALEHRPELAFALRDLLSDAPLVTRRSRESRFLGGRMGRAWCPTPRALLALSEAGVEVPAAPSLDVLRRVNDRRFSIEHLREGPYEAWFTSSSEEARARLAHPSPTGRFLLKHPLGFAGRGRLVAASFDEKTSRFVEASVERFGGVSIEPLYGRTLDVAIHGYVTPSGNHTLGEPTIAEVTRGGTYTSSRRASPGELTDVEETCLREEAAHVANVLAAASFFGPFGLDGFRFVSKGREFLAPRCEINARYTMGWATGMGDRRPDLDVSGKN
jgi:hypothetical protein